ncbi:LysR family transcriptional regulator [Rahnella victoriana]|uniref:LysR family transcriptional regulator n=1 Tax=Rahnella victoriana TaxID=1510570 RepID=UPI001E5C2DEC|nr:LysR family transcriptional regulator [Rahnella victoriana]UHM90521.1 LysR family transcriptional regulator [Rahnella victoriana]
MDRLDAIRLFMRVVECESFSAAAKEAGIGQSAVSKQIAALENQFNHQLLKRSSRGIALTDAGKEFYDGALRLLDEYDQLESSVKYGADEAAGTLRISVAPVFGRFYIVPRLPALFERYPALNIELRVSERHIDLIEENIDIAIRHGELQDSALTQRKLAESPLITVGSPDYLARHGAPSSPAELGKHQCIVFNGGRGVHPWHFLDEQGKPIIHIPQGRFRSNDGEQQRAAALSGMGIAQIPAWLAGPDLASGALVPLLREFTRGAMPVSAVFATRQMANSKVRVFVAYLMETLKIDLPEWRKPLFCIPSED